MGKKRVTVVGWHPVNLFFIRSLEELRDEAKTNGQKSQYTYNHAIRSIQLYPAPLHSGKEAQKMLKHIGENTAQILDRRLKEFRDVNGRDPLLDEVMNQAERTAWRNQLKRNGCSDAQSVDITETPANLSREQRKRKVSQDDNQPSTSTPLQQSPRSSQTKKRNSEYVPKKNSGAYAVLIALHRAMVDENVEFLDKLKLQEMAQPYSEYSMTTSDNPDRDYYNGWSSMSTLIKKNLVVKTSNPAKYFLTDAGRTLAKSLWNTYQPDLYAKSRAQSSVNPSTSSQSGTSTSAVGMASIVQQNLTRPSQHYALPKKPQKATIPEVESNEPEPNVDNRFHYIYLDPEGLDTVNKETAEISIDEVNQTFNYVVKARKLSDLPIGAKIDESRTNRTKGFVVALLQDTLAEQMAPGLSAIPKNISKNSSLESSKMLSSSMVDRPLVAAKPKCLTYFAYIDENDQETTNRDRAKVYIDDSFIAYLVKVPPDYLQRCKSRYVLEKGDGMHAIAYISDADLPENMESFQQKAPQVNIPEPRLVPQALKKASSSTAVVVQGTSKFSERNIRLVPGSYKIFLCVDSIEVSGLGSSDGTKKQLITYLNNHRVPHECRKLNLGDFVWIAKSGKDELILDFIVERKRMDDLSRSILDSRYREQKSRMKRCGLRRPVYLVEDYGTDLEKFTIGKEALLTAIHDTQIIEGFTVHRTRNIEDSVLFLLKITDLLTKTLLRTTLVSCTPQQLVEEFQEVNFAECAELPLLAFEDFQEIGKSSLGGREIFARQLMQFKSLSGGKAWAITERYPTFVALMDAYDNCINAESKTGLLAPLKAEGKLKSIGNALSATVARFFNEKEAFKEW